MKKFRARLVAIDDDPLTLDLITEALRRDDLEILVADQPDAGLELVRRQRPHIVLVDLRMPGMSGLELLERLADIDPAIDVIVITAFHSSASAVEAIQKGACDYLEKPLSIEQLRERIDGLIQDARRRHEAQRLDEKLLEASRFEGMIGRSPLMLEVYARIRRVAPHFRTVLLSGATGTGKELAARALHRLSPVASGQFAVFNCAAVTESLVESELFGHVKGAFTGAGRDKVGLFEFAHGGVLFLDEIGELPLTVQPKLLRALQHQEVRRVGSPAPRKVDIRIVAATNRDLRVAVAKKNFREDLFFRLSMVDIRLPSLQDRKEDLPLLVRHFVEHFSRQYGKRVEGVTRRAETALYRYHWPGNVRELENGIGYACMMTDSTKIDVKDLPESIRSREAQQEDHHFLVSLEEMQRIHARRVVEQLNGDKIRAAEILGVSRATLYRLLAPRAHSAR